MRFCALEIDLFRPGSASRVYTKGWGMRPWGTWARRVAPTSVTDMLRVSDFGYRTREADAGGLKVYPALVSRGFSLERQVNMSPVASAVGSAAASIELANPDGVLDAMVAGWNADGRAVRVYFGDKTLDESRGYFVDPARAALSLAFAGLAAPWYTDTGTVIIPIRDPTYWLEQPIQVNKFGGTGGYDGHSGLAGTNKPKARGGTSGNPIRNVTPVLIDPTTWTYMASDAGGGIVQVYEGGNAGFTAGANTTNLFSGSTSPGTYRTDNSRTCFQLGGPPQGEITADVYGNFPTAGAISAAPDLIRYLLLEDGAVPSGNVYAASFSAAATAYPYTAGVYFAPGDTASGVEAVDRILQPLGARLFLRRDGQLALLMLRALASSAAAVANYGPTNAMGWEPEQIEPPSWRFTLNCKQNWTRQTTGISASATAAWKAFVAGAGEAVAWSSSVVASSYARPSDRSISSGALLVKADAQACADAIGALFGARRPIGWIEVPSEVGLAREIGDIVRINWPAADLRSPRLGIVVGDHARTQDGTMKLRVLL